MSRVKPIPRFHPRRRPIPALPVALLLLLILPVQTAQAEDGHPDPARPSLRFEAGKVRLQWHGADLLADCLPAAERVVFESRRVDPEKGFWDFDFKEGPLAATGEGVDPKAGTAHREYEWGTLTVRYRLEQKTLRLRLLASNKTKQPIANFRFRLLGLRLAGRSAELQENGIKNTIDQPIAIELKSKSGRLFACYETFYPPVRFGIGSPGDKAGDTYPLIVAGGLMDMPKGAVAAPPAGIPRIPPGETLELDFVLRFAEPDVYRHQVLRDFYKAYQAFQSPMLEWPDRRPIGACFILREHGKAAPRTGVEGTNPRRLWSPVMDAVDVFAPHGQAMLRRQFAEMARKTADALKQMDAQGMILWNLEGAFHGTGWVGDPRMQPILSPECSRGLDDYFRIIREAGFRVGCTIRHQQVMWWKGRWIQNAGNVNPNGDPILDGYDRLVPKHQPWWTVYPTAQRLSAKIDYAKERWGSTIFYYDVPKISTMYLAANGEIKSFRREPPAHIYRRIRQDHPDVLIIPEHGKIAAHSAHLAPYGQTGVVKLMPFCGPDYRRDIIPGYFGVNCVHDSGDDPWRERLARVHELVWGETLMVDGWQYGRKQWSISEHYRQAGAKQRRVIALARRFGLVENPRELLPLPYALEKARQLNAADLVLNPPGFPHLRAFTASSKDQREAVLMLAWYGWHLAAGTELRPDLPGVKLAGKRFNVWDLETGNLLNSATSVQVPAAPATGLRALYIRVADRMPPPRPAGVALAVSFDRGLTPDLGGGLLGKNGDASLVDGKAGRALRIRSGGGVARYGVVPSWFSGTLELDLRVKAADLAPLPLVKLSRHMDASLWLVRDKDAPALRLETRERRATLFGIGSTELSAVVVREEGGLKCDWEPPQLRTALAPLPDDGAWHRVVIAWEMGQYRVYVDGRRAATIAAPAIVRWRDASVLQPGLALGGDADGGGSGQAAIDSLVLYDWAFADAEAKGRTAKVGLRPFPKPKGLQPSVWLWGPSAKKASRIAVNFRRCLGGRRAQHVSAVLFEETRRGLRQLSAGSAPPYRGVATFVLTYEPKAQFVVPDLTESGTDADPTGDLKELTNATRKYVLKITGKRPGQKLPERRIKLEFDLDGTAVRHW